MLKISSIQKVVFVLVILALLGGVFAFNFMRPGYAIDIAAGRNKNNNVTMSPDGIHKLGNAAPDTATMRNLFFTNPTPEPLILTNVVRLPGLT